MEKTTNLRRPRFCASCGRSHDATDTLCRVCGSALALAWTSHPRTKACATCGATSPTDAAFCIGCGVSWHLENKPLQG
ncbi:MAG TPA: zinc ribbon domain-containing protein [Chloroflexota bacterium]|nr:zinc ribbon domain-containing protein [Chloroflexota bacterium]